MFGIAGAGIVHAICGAEWSDHDVGGVFPGAQNGVEGNESGRIGIYLSGGIRDAFFGRTGKVCAGWESEDQRDSQAQAAAGERLIKELRNPLPCEASPV